MEQLNDDELDLIRAFALNDMGIEPGELEDIMDMMGL